jgi:selenocysteine-specific elongation factor
VLTALCGEAGPAGIEVSTLPVRLGIAPDAVSDVVSSRNLVVTGERVYVREAWMEAEGSLLSAVDREHGRDSLSPGLPLEQARTAAGVPRDLFDLVLGHLVNSGQLAVTGAVVHREGWVASLSESQRRLSEQMMHAFCSSDEPTMAIADVTGAFGPGATVVLRHLERDGQVVRLGETLVAAEPAVRRLVGQLSAVMETGRGYSPAELRDALGISRKVLIPLLEYCDRIQLTERKGSERVLRGASGVETFRALDTSK